MYLNIQFDDQNHALAAAIGAALYNYGMGVYVVTDSDDVVNGKTSGVIPIADVKDYVEPVTETEPEPTPPLTEDDTVETPPTPTDEHGVEFDPGFCAKSAKDPFYASGKNQGKWKRKRGLAVETYDNWYAGQLPVEAETTTVPVDTAAAFEASPAAVDTDLPTEPGAFMLWCSEQTAAQKFTTEQVTAAYAQCGITVADMFGGDQAVTSGHVANLLKALGQ